jgi:uncharacterized OsmC-like protein
MHRVRAVVVIPGVAEHPAHEVFVQSDVADAATSTGFVRFGLAPDAGGPNPSPSRTGPTALLVQSLAACAGTTMRAVATSMGLSFDRLLLTVSAQYDGRGTMAVSRSTPVGIQSLDVHLDVVTVHCLSNGVVHNAKEWERLVASGERYCVVAQSLLAGATGLDGSDEPLEPRPAQPKAHSSSYTVWHQADTARTMMEQVLGQQGLASLPLPKF